MGGYAKTLTPLSVFEDYFNVKRDALAAGDGVADDTARLQAAIDSVNVLGGVVFFPPGTYRHTGLVISNPFVRLLGAGSGGTSSGGGVILHNVGTGPNISVAALANHCSVDDIFLTGVLTSTHGLSVIDALWFSSNRLCIQSWGANSDALRLNSLADPGGNGAHYAEIFGIDILGNGVTGGTGIHLMGTAAGCNRARFYGGSVRSCVVGAQLDYCSGANFFGTDLEANTTAVNLGALAANFQFWGCAFESNPTQVNIHATASDGAFIFCSFVNPNQSTGIVGTGARINWLWSLTGVGPQILTSRLDVQNLIRQRAYGVTSTVDQMIVASATPVTVANTVVETTLGTLVCPAAATANTLAIGDVLEIEAAGVYSTANGTDFCTLLLNIAGGFIPWALSTPAGAVTNKAWTLRIKVFVTGVSGTASVECSGYAIFNNTLLQQINTAVVVIGNPDSGISWLLDAIWSNALAGNTITCRQFTVRLSNKIAGTS